jgi:hypothetical protein
VKRRAIALLLVGTAAAVGSAGGGTGVRPPPGIPDLSQIAVRTTDLTAGGVARQGYVKPDDPFVASYAREFRVLSPRLGTKRLLALEHEVDLARSASVAKELMAAIPLGLALLDPADLAKEASSGSFHPKYVKLGKLAHLAARDEALEVTIRMGTQIGEIRAFLVFHRFDRVISTLVVVAAPRSGVGIVDATRLVRTIAGHAHDALVPVNTVRPAVTGTAQVGQPLTASSGAWSNSPTGFAYSWQRCDATGASCVDTGSTGTTYTAAAADAGSTVRVAVVATNTIGQSKVAYSPVTTVVAGAPLNTAPPAIAGTAAVGQPLSASTGTWTGSPTSFAYQWQRCDATGASCAAIAGATAATYTVDAADAGSTLRVAVTATNATGTSAPAVSAQTAVVSG